MDWKKQCHIIGINPDEYCGPYVNAVGSVDFPAANCCYNHALKSPLHKQPLVKGKPFRLADYKEEFQKAKVSFRPKELKEEFKAGKPPPGNPKTINGVKVYPARHFA